MTTRRSFLQGAAAIAVSPLLPADAKPQEVAVVPTPQLTSATAWFLVVPEGMEPPQLFNRDELREMFGIIEGCHQDQLRKLIWGAR